MKRLWIALGVIALDQGSKFLAVRYLAPSGPVTLIPGVLGLRYAENTGMAFSMFAGRSWLLGLCSLGLLVLAWLFLRRYEMGKVAGAAAMLMLGGAVGNLVDRFFTGYVVDMFDLEFMSYPIFNLADIFVVIGVLLGAVYYLWFYDKYDKPKKEPDHDAGADSRN